MAVSQQPVRTERAARLFGRSEIHDAVVATLEQTRRSEGQIVLLAGTGGVGKSTLLRQTVQDARQRGFVVAEGRALPSDLPQPFALVQDLLRSVATARVAPTEGAPEDPSFLGIFLAPFDTDRGGPGGPSPEGDGGLGEAGHLLDYLAGPPARVEESRTLLLDRLTDYFLDIARRDPLLLAIDDLHLADDSSFEFLAALARALGAARLAVVATVASRAETPQRTAPLLDQLVTGDHASRLTVRPMTEPEVAEYARWILNGRDPGREAVLRWYTQTEGNPLFVEYVVRASAGPGSGISAPATPPGQDLDEMLQARARALAEGDRRVLIYATVLGKEFDFPTLAVAVGGQEEERLAESVDRLVHSGLFREKGGEVYEFVSERIRAEAYAQLTETRRRILHRKVARALEGRGRTDAAIVFELARQFYLAREDASAVEYNRRAAELASRAYAHDTAVVHLERALESLRRQADPDAATELHLMVELGRVLDENEDFRRSEGVLLQAVERARVDKKLESQLALALLWLARTRGDLGEFSSARTLASEAFSILERMGNQRGLLVAHRVLGIACWRVGELVDAERHQRAEIALAEKEEDSRERGHALIDLGNTLVSQGKARLPEALELYESAVRLFSDGKDYIAHARVLMNEALLHHNNQDMPKAVDCLDRAIESAERSHSRIWIGYCRMNQAQFNVELHKLPEARVSLDRARTVLEPLGDQFANQQLTMIDAMIQEGEGKLAQAFEQYSEALRLARDLHLEAEAAESQFRRARLTLHRGEAPVARTEFEAAKAIGLLRLKGELVYEAEALERELAAAGAPAKPEAPPPTT
ncbi:MAG TPA: AAA family ATPase [Thermoplasmata archaeon]|nr:AAA family ATPase [Thermoplasmata archaeon]